MKKFVPPLLLASAVFFTTVYFQPFTILRQEGLGLFLNTPDFYRALFFDPFPLSNLIGSFLIQFYSNVYVGAAIVALLVVSVFSLSGAILSRFGIKLDSMSVLCASAAWLFIAKAASPAMGVAISLLFSVILLLSLFFRKRREERLFSYKIDMLATLVVIIAAVLLVVFNPKIKEGEKWSAIEFAAVQGEWDYLLKKATPEEARKDMQIVPYALLALNAKGQLADRLSEYPIMENFGLDFGDEVTYRRSLFDAVLYGSLGCWNEAIHRTHQCGDYLPHCTSFRTLRMLVRENYELGDSLMVVKYCDILDKSFLHMNFVRYYRENPVRQRICSTPEESSKALLIMTKDPMNMMLNLVRAGIDSPMVMERYYAYYKIKEFFRNDTD